MKTDRNTTCLTLAFFKHCESCGKLYLSLSLSLSYCGPARAPQGGPRSRRPGRALPPPSMIIIVIIIIIIIISSSSSSSRSSRSSSSSSRCLIIGSKRKGESRVALLVWEAVLYMRVLFCLCVLVDCVSIVVALFGTTCLKLLVKYGLHLEICQRGWNSIDCWNRMCLLNL